MNQNISLNESGSKMFQNKTRKNKRSTIVLDSTFDFKTEGWKCTVMRSNDKSMSPLCKQGDLVIVDTFADIEKTIEEKDSCTVIVSIKWGRNGYELIMRQIFKSTDGEGKRYVLKPLNNKYPDMTLYDWTDYKLLGIVVAIKPGF